MSFLLLNQAFALSGTQKLSLEDAMNLAEERSFSARNAKLNTEIADAKTDQANGMALPRLDLDAQKIWFSQSVNKLAGKSPLSPDEVTTAALQVVQPIIGLGPLLMQIKAAKLQFQNAQNDEASTKRDARQMAASAYINSQKANQFVTLASSALTVSENQNREANSLFRAGRISQVDVSKFELSLLDSKQQLTLAKTTQEIAALSLSEILRHSGTLFELEDLSESRFEKLSPTLPEVTTTEKMAAEKRPETVNAQNGIEIAEYYKLASDLDYLPSLNAFARYERNFEATDQTLGGTAQSPGLKVAKNDLRDSLSMGLKLNWNIWDWGTRWNRTSEYAATVQKARIGKESAESNIRIDAVTSHLQLKANAEGLNTAKTASKLSEEVYRLTKVRFQNGQATSTDVILAEREQTRAQSALVNARGELDLSWIKYQKALGIKPTFLKN